MRQIGKTIAAVGRMRGLGDRRTREERMLAGRVTGILYFAGVLGATAMLLLPGPELHRPGLLIAAGALGLIWGIASLSFVPWNTLPAIVSYVSSAGGWLIIAAVFAGSDGTAAPVLLWTFFIVAFAAFFYPWPVALAYVTVSALVALGLVLGWPDAFGTDNGPRLAAVGFTVIAVVGFLIAAGRGLLVRLREDAHRLTEDYARLAEEQSALRRVATAVAAGSPPSAVFAHVASEVARLVGADAASVAKLVPGEQAMIMGSWSKRDRPRLEAGSVISVRNSRTVRRIAATMEPVRTRSVDHRMPLGYGLLVTAPIQAGATLWGGLSVMTRDPDGLPEGAEHRLRDFAALVATAIGNAEDRSRLATMAASDSLTGLANHRVFQERLRTEVSRSRRHGRPVCVALIDVDRFSELNDRAGHEAGDAILTEIANVLRSLARDEDVLARLGGDEFALLLPETDRSRAYGVCERIRTTIAETAFRHRERLTISTGICDLEIAGDADAMYRLAEGALYWSKAHGRDVTWIYDPAVVRELNAAERAEQLERTQALTGLRALARAVDAKDASTSEHSERVAALAGRLAAVSGWSSRRVAQLTEAALVHDVGKIGVPDALLVKPTALTADEYELVKGHVALGAQIVGDVLGAEQVRWIETHHERPDGSGYPVGLTGQDIPEGGALLALADAWDVMTCARTYSRAMSEDEAVAEISSLVGRQFTRHAVDALLTLRERGELADVAARLHRPAPATIQLDDSDA